jgi:two-component system, NarL family, nitrate/nitrite response regulator NarL
MKPKMKPGHEIASPVSFSNGAQLPSRQNREERGTNSVEYITRILLVDDHPVLRKGLIACLSDRSNLIVVGEATDGLEAINKVGELSPDLVLMDVEMPRMGGLEATQAICKQFPQTKVLVLSMHNNPDYVVQAIQMGARGFALKTSPSEELVKAIEIVQRGEPFFPGQNSASDGHSASKKDAAKDPNELYEREKEVLVHLAAGFGNKEIAELLHISVRTVESHRARLMKKLNIHTIAGLTRYALSHGFISLSPSFSIPEFIDPTIPFPAGRGLRM